MKFRQMPRTDLTATDKLVIWRIATRCNPNNVGAWPSHTTVAKELGIGASTAHTSLRKGVDLGVLKEVERGGGTRTTVYDINLEFFDIDRLSRVPSANPRWRSQAERDAYPGRADADIVEPAGPFSGGEIPRARTHACACVT